MQLLLDYVLFHFKRVYYLPEPLEISYGQDGHSRIQIQQTPSNFFQQQKPHPEQVIWKDWNGTQLPMFFDASPEADWLTSDTNGYVTVQFDLVASAFFLLSGWQEFYSPERDQYGRIPYKASIQAKHGLVTKPVVNYYFDILKAAVEKAYGQPVALRTWKGKKFATCLTHDIDYLQSAWKVAGKPALQQGKLGPFFRLLSRKLKGKDAWYNLSEVARELAKLPATSTFFFLPQKGKSNGQPNADYDITSTQVQQEIKRLAATGHEIALHGSHGSGSTPGQLASEQAKINVPMQGNRFHYLRFDPAMSLDILEQTGVRYDSSLGFPEHFGFRNSFCHPFRLYNFKKQQMSSVWELPLNLMDITLNHPNYLQLSPEEVMPAITPMLQEIERFQGVFTLLWHNENFSPYGLPGGLQLFREIAQYLQIRGTTFLTAASAIQNMESARG
ncbi:MAG: polysaccharide deacetylase family protein [Rufibacter sp.]